MVLALGVLLFAPMLHAGVAIVNNTGFTRDGGFGAPSGSDTTPALGEVFTTTSATSIGSLTLSLHFTGTPSASVYLYDTASGKPTGTGTLLGTVSSSSSTIIGLNNALLASTTYAIVLSDNSGSGSLSWDYISPSTSSGSGGTAVSPLGGGFVYSGGTWSSGGSLNFQMDVEPVPEVPTTGVFMGFGVLAIAMGNILRRKLGSGVSR